jgi:hypothetical protein
MPSKQETRPPTRATTGGPSTDSKRACLSEARKILRQAHHILAELGDDALAAA